MFNFCMKLCITEMLRPMYWSN